MDFQRLAGPRNVSVDLKYDVLCLWVFVVYLFESGEVTAWILYWWADRMLQPYIRECYRTLWLYWERKTRLEKIVATKQLMLALIKGVVDVGVVFSLKPILKSWQLCLSFKLDVRTT